MLLCTKLWNYFIDPNHVFYAIVISHKERQLEFQQFLEIGACSEHCTMVTKFCSKVSPSRSRTRPPCRHGGDSDKARYPRVGDGVRVRHAMSNIHSRVRATMLKMHGLRKKNKCCLDQGLLG